MEAVGTREYACVKCQSVERLSAPCLSLSQKVVDGLLIGLWAVTLGQFDITSSFNPRCQKCGALLSLNYWRGTRLVEPSEIKERTQDAD